ncbi:MAG: hypothetical protein V4596_06440 [Bdellovibrionota bacterium]
MKLVFALFLSIFALNFAVAEESAVQKIDRSAQEAVDEVKVAGKKIVRKLQKATNNNDTKAEDSKKKDLKE